VLWVCGLLTVREGLPVAFNSSVQAAAERRWGSYHGGCFPALNPKNCPKGRVEDGSC
jgi:hypothetical protein